MEDVLKLTLTHLRLVYSEFEAQKWVKSLKALPLYQVPMFLRQGNADPALIEIAFYEVLKNQILTEDMGQLKSHPSGYCLNSSLGLIQIQKSAHVFNKRPGTYALFKMKRGKDQAEIAEISEALMTESDLQVLEILTDDLIQFFSDQQKVAAERLCQLGILEKSQITNSVL